MNDEPYKEPYKVISLGLFSDRVEGPGIDKTFNYNCDDNEDEAKWFCEYLNTAYEKGYRAAALYTLKH